MYWGYSWDYIGHVLGHILGLYWDYTGVMLGLYWGDIVFKNATDAHP